MSLILRTPADAAFSLCVRERAGWRCERCGSSPAPGGLHCAHVMSRGSWLTRFDPCNALALCYGCHKMTERKREDEFIPLVKATFGELAYDRVYADSKKVGRGVRKAVPEIAKHYRAQHAAMVKLRDAGSTGRLDFVGWMS